MSRKKKAEKPPPRYSVGDLRDPQPDDARHETEQGAYSDARNKSYPDRVMGVWDGASLIAIAYDGLVYWP